MGKKTAFARALRKNQTDAEEKLWQRLRNRQVLDFKFRRQYVVDGYIADFACVEARLIIELDGGQHIEQKPYDDKRTRTLENHGFTVLRFWNHEVLQQTEDVLAVVYKVLDDEPSPSKRERGQVSNSSAKGEGVKAYSSFRQGKWVKVILGLGCDRGTPAETIHTAIVTALASASLTVDNVMAAASIDKKSDEVGLLQVCAHHGWECTWYPASTLAKVDVPNPSAVVMKYVGTPSVGEAAAILRAGGSKEDLIVEKYKYKGHDGKNATVSICKIKG